MTLCTTLSARILDTLPPFNPSTLQRNESEQLPLGSFAVSGDRGDSCPARSRRRIRTAGAPVFGRQRLHLPAAPGGKSLSAVGHPPAAPQCRYRPSFSR